jgi:2-keto-4-pentenoate hydratase
MKGWLGVLVAALLVVGCQSIDVVQDGGFRISQAMLQNQPAPLLSPIYGKALTGQHAYRIQRVSLEQVLRGQRPAGFKAGLTSAAAQQQFGSPQPIAGVLPPGGEIPASEDGYRVLVKTFRKAGAEAEIGYRLTRRVSAPLPDVVALKAIVAEIVPVVELPELAMAGGKPTALDLIATNVGAKRYLAGPGRAPSLTDPNRVQIEVYREGEPVSRGVGRDVSGDQWQALLWLVNRTVESGWSIEPGQLLITGTVGKSFDVQPGLYVADFGDFARIEFTVE